MIPMNRRIHIAGLAGLAVLSAFIVYPVVHEGGHYLTGRALGAEVRNVVWTPLTGRRPHVSFGNTPGEIVPWVLAAGVILPSLVGGLGLVLWVSLGRRWPFSLQGALLIPTVVLLAGNLGFFGELFGPPNLQRHHMYPLAHHLGLNGIPSFLFQLAPAAVSIALLIFIVGQVRAMKRKETTPDDVEGLG